MTNIRAKTLETMRMKTPIIYILLLILIISFSCNDENDTNYTNYNCTIEIPADTYIFPMTPASPEWSNFYPREIWEINQLPDSIIENISTEGLFETCLTFPYYSDIGLADYHQYGFDHYVDNFNGIFEFLNRDNSSNIIFERYKSMHLPCDNNNYPDFTGRGQWIGSAFIGVEMILAQYIVLNRFDSEQLKLIATEALLKHDEKISDESTYSIFNIKFTLVLCGRILEIENYQPFITELNTNENLELFLAEVYLNGNVESLEIIRTNTLNYINTK